jgi:membrane fusion protein (multidrug efflux system)
MTLRRERIRISAERRIALRRSYSHTQPMVAPASVVVLTLALTACGGEPPAASQIAERTFVVETIATTAQDIRVTVDAVGTIAASERADLRPQVDGVLAAILFEEGADVAQGDLLLRLDDRKATARLRVAEAALASAEARLRLLEQRLKRQKRLFADRLISEQEYEAVDAEYSEVAASAREQEAAVTLAQRELDEYGIAAPFAGRIGERLVDVGNYVSEGTLLAVLMRTDPAHVLMKVPDRFADRIAIGTKVDIATGSSNTSVGGTVDFIDPRVDPSTRMLSLRASVANPDERLLHGQFVQISVLVEERAAQVVIPEEAVLSAAGNTWVFVVNEGLAERRNVTLGERRPPTVEILDGVTVGEVVVVGGQHRLRDGARVSTVEPPSGGS